VFEHILRTKQNILLELADPASPLTEEDSGLPEIPIPVRPREIADERRPTPRGKKRPYAAERYVREQSRR
jgi:hypothetical protein